MVALDLLRTAGLGRVLVAGWLYGFITIAWGFSWIAHLLTEFAGAPRPLAAGGLLLLSLAQGGQFAATTVLGRLLERRAGWSLPAAFLVAFVACELAFPVLFPWYLGNALYRHPLLLQHADLVGILGVSLLPALFGTALGAMAVAALRRQPLPWRWPVAAAAYAAAALAYGAVRIPQVDAAAARAEPLRVALIQTNLGSRDKHVRRDAFIAEHLSMSLDAERDGPDLIVWPESGYNEFIARTSTSVRVRVMRGLATPLLFGALTYEPRPGTHGAERRFARYNTALLADRDGRILGRFDKQVLLAFGEYIPGLSLLPFLEKWLPYTGVFDRGTSLAPLPLGRHDLAVDICYEDILPRFIQRQVVGSSPRRPHALFNLTNDSWYGDSAEPTQHLALAMLRAVEHRRALVRSTNTGISAIVDPAGRIVARSGQWTQEIVRGSIPMMADGGTVYERIGDVLGWAALGLAAAGLLRPLTRRAPRPRTR